MSKANLPLVSIAIPTYNRADTLLKDSINSALKQTYQNIEILVSDNCSTDDTEAVVKGFNDKRIRYFKQIENIGAIPNSNYCLDQAKGVYFTQLHDDNLMDAEFIEICMEAVNFSSEIGVIRAGTRQIDTEGNILNEYPNMAKGLSTDDYFRAIISGKTVSYLCSTLFLTEKVQELGGFHSQFNLLEDVMAEIRIATKHGRHDIQEILASFRVHESKMGFAASVSDWCKESLMLIDLMCELAPQNKNLVRSEGMRGLASYNYQLANKIQDPLEKIKAYFCVLRSYNYRQLPPKIHGIIFGNIFVRGLQYLQRRVLQEWVMFNYEG